MKNLSLLPRLGVVMAGLVGFSLSGCGADNSLPGQLELTKPHLDKLKETDQPVDKAKPGI